MPFQTNPNPPTYRPSQVLPQHLEHKPVYGLPYDSFDGLFAGSSDVQYLSVGLAQYDADDVSAKAMRHIGSQWSRQAEEVPLHRTIDMTLLIAKAIFDQQPNGDVIFTPGTLQRQTSEITVSPEARTVNERASYDAAVNTLTPILLNRLNALRDVLNDLKRRGRI